jgi:integrase
MRLTATTIRSLSLPAGTADKVFFDDDVPGFGIRLRAGGSQTWLFQYRFGAKHRRMTFGRVSAMSIERARQTARDLYAQVRLGGDPAGDKREARARAAETFGWAMESFLAHQERRLKRRSLVEVQRHMRVNARPLHHLELAKVDRRSIAAQLTRLAEMRGAVTANRARATWSSFFSWCAREGLIDTNPAALTNVRHEASRERVLTDNELRSIWRALQDDDYGDIIRLLMLTGARRTEIAGLSWPEIDFEKGVITLPPSRTKNGRENVIPMAAAVRAILEARPKLHGRDFLFGRGAGGFTGWSCCKGRLDAAAGIKDWTPHDLRRTMATKMADELGQTPHIIEAVLNHVGHKVGVHGVYNRAAYLPEKKQALALWADHVMAIIEGKASNVTPLRRA